MTFIDWVDENLPRIKERLRFKVRAMHHNVGECKYRLDGDANNMAPKNCCFIGYCIKPEHYKPEMDNRSIDTSVGSVVHRFPEAFGGLKLDDPEGLERAMMEKLQKIHDCGRIGDWDELFATWLDQYQTYKQSHLAPRG